MESSWEQVTDSESLLEWELANGFIRISADETSFLADSRRDSLVQRNIRSSPLSHASAKAQPSNPRSPFVSIPSADVHFSLTDLTPGLPAPSLGTTIVPTSLQMFPHDDPLPLPSLAETTPKSLRLDPSAASDLAQRGSSSEVVIESHVEKRAKTHHIQSSQLPKLGSQANRAAMLRSKQPSTNPFIVQQFKSILNQLDDKSGLALALKESRHPDIHLHRVLDEFAPSTVLKYTAGIRHFLKLCSEFKLQWHNLRPMELADLLLQSSLNKSSDESSVGGKNIIKSMRWCAKVMSVLSLGVFRDPLVDSFLSTKRPSDQQETAPLPLWAVVQFERRLLQKSASINEVLFLGSCLIAIWGGLRYADAQRLPLSSFVLDKNNIRGSCFRSKTSHKGQPFGCTTAGFLSHGTFNWTIKWLQTVDDIWHQSGIPDIEAIFIQWTQDKLHILSYGETIQMLRHYLLTPWRSQKSPLSDFTINFALHSMKTTFLAWTAQRSDIFTEEQRMVQGHHKSQKSSSLRRYSRDDVYPQLQLQASLTSLVQSGWRPALAQHRGAQTPMREPEVVLERFRKDHEPLTWKRFQFLATPKDQPDQEISLVHDNSEEMQDDQSDSSSESDSSSSSSSSNRSGISVSKPSKEDSGCSEEIFVGWTTHIQHAVRVDPSPKPGTPRFDGIAWRSMCGARLNPLMKFSDQPKPDLAYCRKPACVKAWSCMESG